MHIAIVLIVVVVIVVTIDPTSMSVCNYSVSTEVQHVSRLINDSYNIYNKLIIH